MRVCENNKIKLVSPFCVETAKTNNSRRLDSSVCEMLSIVGIYRFTADLLTTYAIYVIRRSSTRTSPVHKGGDRRTTGTTKYPNIKTRCAVPRWLANTHCEF